MRRSGRVVARVLVVLFAVGVVIGGVTVVAPQVGAQHATTVGTVVSSELYQEQHVRRVNGHRRTQTTTRCRSSVEYVVDGRSYQVNGLTSTCPSSPVEVTYNVKHPELGQYDGSPMVFVLTVLVVMLLAVLVLLGRRRLPWWLARLVAPSSGPVDVRPRVVVGQVG